ncbi:uncharacterized protein TNIN_450761 [Trichonephila inaurata madagascariensis]|uniref:Uncharacterized protein n=1 Tax=Trichonephila inaurata madagascariensis TaxID=2747483 RepID=A0A8X6MAK0_9ARAC|nr:uncharacterized protein TNIN_450761 [Trichonephila inaurata madagascariensis]
MSEASSSTVKHKRQLPPDGCLKPLSNKKIGSSCNVVIIKVPDELKKPGESTYRLAYLDPILSETDWSADKIIHQLIHGSSQESQKPTPDVSENPPVYFRERRLKPKKKVDTSLPEQDDKKKISANDIDPWIKKPWEDSSYLGVNPVLSANSSSSMISSLPYFRDIADPACNPILSKNPGSSLISSYNNIDASNSVYNSVLPMNPKPRMISNLPYSSMNMPGPTCSSYDPETMHNVYMPTNNTIYENNYGKNLRYKEMSRNSYMNNCAGNQRNEILMSTMPDSSRLFVRPSNKGLIRNDTPSRKGLLGDYPGCPHSFNKNFVRFPRENLRLGNNHASFEYSKPFGNNSLSSELHLKGSHYQSGQRDGNTIE